MRLHNPWVGYLERTYSDYKQKILERIKISNPEITDLRETNIFVILVSIFSGLAEQLGFYVDKTARESYLSTAQKFSSVVKLVKILDYRIKTRLPATVTVYFTYLGNNGTASDIEEPGTIPAGTVIQTEDGMVFLTDKALTIPIGKSTGKVTARQWQISENNLLGATTGLPKQEIELPEEYSHNSLNLEIDGEPWQRVQTLASSLPQDKHYVVDVDEDKIPRIKLGNGINGAIPAANKNVIGTYYITTGALGNEVPPGMINSIASTLVLPQPATQVIVRNPTSPVAGADLEDIDSIRFNAPLSTKTVERAVTPDDFNYLAQRADGVGKASVVYNCGPTVEVYISPINGGIATAGLIEDTEEYLNSIRLLGVRPIVKAAGETPISIALSVTPRFRVDKTILTNEIKTVLLERFSTVNNQINGRIAVSDIIAVVDNLSKVDFVEIEKLYTMPYAYPLNHDTQLDWDRETLPGSKEQINWQVNYTSSGFRVWREGLYLGVVPFDTEYTDSLSIIRLRFNAGAMYEEGQTWTFTTYPYNATIRLTDNTIPLVTDGSIEITINNPS